MSLITELDVVNDCLGIIGETPINSLSSPDPIITGARDVFRKTTIKVQTKGWWFNKENITLNPTTSHEYFPPSDTLALTDTERQPWLSIRAGKLYDNRVGTPFSGTKAIQVNIIRLVAFDNLPILPQQYTQALTVFRFCQRFDADSSKLAQSKLDSDTAYALFNAEHIRNCRANMLGDGFTAEKRYQHMFHGAIRRGFQ